MVSYFFFFFKQKTAYEMRISDWSSDVCSSDLEPETARDRARGAPRLALPEPVAVPSLTLDWRPGSCPSQSACRVQSCRSRLNAPSPGVATSTRCTAPARTARVRTATCVAGTRGPVRRARPRGDAGCCLLKDRKRVV